MKVLTLHHHQTDQSNQRPLEPIGTIVQGSVKLRRIALFVVLFFGVSFLRNKKNKKNRAFGSFLKSLSPAKPWGRKKRERSFFDVSLQA